MKKSHQVSKINLRRGLIIDKNFDNVDLNQLSKFEKYN